MWLHDGAALKKPCLLGFFLICYKELSIFPRQKTRSVEAQGADYHNMWIV
jgi:hypothetical protein